MSILDLPDDIYNVVLDYMWQDKRPSDVIRAIFALHKPLNSPVVSKKYKKLCCCVTGCYNPTSSHRSGYCKEHRCKYIRKNMQCRMGRNGHSDYCIKHTCRYQDCQETVYNNQVSFCEEHCCKQTRITQNGTKISCSGMLFTQTMCIEHYMSHKCEVCSYMRDVASCNCYIHTCRIESCREPVYGLENKLCSEHSKEFDWCHYEECENIITRDMHLCDKHRCCMDSCDQVAYKYNKCFVHYIQCDACHVSPDGTKVFVCNKHISYC